MEKLCNKEEHLYLFHKDFWSQKVIDCLIFYGFRKEHIYREACSKHIEDTNIFSMAIDLIGDSAVEALFFVRRLHIKPALSDEQIIRLWVKITERSVHPYYEYLELVNMASSPQLKHEIQQAYLKRGEEITR